VYEPHSQEEKLSLRHISIADTLLEERSTAMAHHLDYRIADMSRSANVSKVAPADFVSHLHILFYESLHGLLSLVLLPTTCEQQSQASYYNITRAHKRHSYFSGMLASTSSK
jgi:hypothetical protein